MKLSGIYVNLILSCSVLFLSLEVCACRFMLTLQNGKCVLCIVRRIQISRMYPLNTLIKCLMMSSCFQKAQYSVCSFRHLGDNWLFVLLVHDRQLNSPCLSSLLELAKLSSMVRKVAKALQGTDVCGNQFVLCGRQGWFVLFKCTQACLQAQQPLYILSIHCIDIIIHSFWSSNIFSL